MKNKLRKKLCICACALAAFALWTAAVCLIDVQPIGPQESAVGFAVLNRSFHSLTGVHMTLYTFTDWLGLVPVAFGLGFALLGLQQWIRRRSLRRVEPSILVLGGFYIVVAAAYILFEAFVINYRPVLINGILEASYPSSTTLLVACIMPTTAMQLNARRKNSARKRCINLSIVAFTAFMIIGRLLSGVHWFTDIIGSVLLSTGLVALYAFFSDESP
jgi:undecaprenyl-diphosphatase